VQVDSCGAWLTVATSERRPVVVRRAGWTELRGQQSADPVPRWDRIGLGPGDAFVGRLGGGGDDDAVLDGLLAHAGHDARTLGEALLLTGATAYVVVRVPVHDPGEGVRRASEATGLPASTFERPLHQPGSADAELWSHRPAPPMEARVRLEPVVASVPAARDLLRRLVSSWRMGELLDEVLEVLATETVTNAVVHARTPIVAVIRYDGSAIRFEVHDRDPHLPRPLEPSIHAEGGRGLWLVATLAHRWAAEAEPGGKRVWFEVDVDGTAPHDAAVIYAHGVLRVARLLEHEARSLRDASPESADRAAAFAAIRDRTRLISDMLTDVVRGVATPR
jgi:anti-sigma regulatory factor (Ser/Thr protein kinase)